MTKHNTDCNRRENGRAEKPYDLEERTAVFGEAIIDFAKIYRG